jgi:hypothetical protein
VQPAMQLLDQRPTAQLTSSPTQIGRLAADAGLDVVELADARQHRGGERRLGRGVELIERSARMRPAECQPDRGILAGLDQTAEPGIAVDLQDASECRQVRGRVLAPTILGIDIGRRRMRRSGPGPIIDGVAAEPPGLGPATAGLEHRQGRLVGKHLVRGQHRVEHQFVERRQPPARASDPGTQGRAVQRDALTLEHLRLAIQRQGVTLNPAVGSKLGRHCATVLQP